MTNSDSSEFQLKDAPKDGISSVDFSPSLSNYLLASSWDGTLRIYDVNENSMKNKFDDKLPFLDCCYVSNESVYGAGMNKTIKCFDVEKSSEKTIGVHEMPIRCLKYCSKFDVILSGSWDGNVCAWDGKNANPSFTLQNNDKVFSLDCNDYLVIVATANRKLLIWDVRKTSLPIYKKESTLKYQTRCVKFFPDGKGYVLGSIEGRVAVEFLDGDSQIGKYAFKCHRTTQEDGVEYVYPVNAISFHKQYSTFATGGSDGVVNTWDAVNKKRLFQFKKYPSSISSLAFNDKGTLLAIASSFKYEENIKEIPPDSIFIRKINDIEVKSKS